MFSYMIQTGNSIKNELTIQHCRTKVVNHWSKLHLQIPVDIEGEDSSDVPIS